MKTGNILAAQYQHRTKHCWPSAIKTKSTTPVTMIFQAETCKMPLHTYPCRYRPRVSIQSWRIPNTRYSEPHYGVDFAAPHNHPSTYCGQWHGNYGTLQRRLWKDDQSSAPRNRVTVYGHLSAFAKGIKRGKKVRRGQVIGYVGSTGLSTGPHLHYEIRINKAAFNPLTVLPAGKNLTASSGNLFTMREKRLQQLNEHGYTTPDPFLTQTAGARPHL